jgi:hypothetical protein
VKVILNVIMCKYNFHFGKSACDHCGTNNTSATYELTNILNVTVTMEKAWQNSCDVASVTDYILIYTLCFLYRGGPQ